MKKTKESDIIDVEPIQENQEEQSVSPTFYWLVRCTVVYAPKKGRATQPPRPLNLLLDTPTPNIVKYVLGQINELAAQFAVQRHGTKPEEISDIVIDNICSLGHMTLAQFEQTPPMSMGPAEEIPAPTQH